MKWTKTTTFLLIGALLVCSVYFLFPNLFGQHAPLPEGNATYHLKEELDADETLQAYEEVKHKRAAFARIGLDVARLQEQPSMIDLRLDIKPQEAGKAHRDADVTGTMQLGGISYDVKGVAALVPHQASSGRTAYYQGMFTGKVKDRESEYEEDTSMEIIFAPSKKVYVMTGIDLGTLYFGDVTMYRHLIN